MFATIHAWWTVLLMVVFVVIIVERQPRRLIKLVLSRGAVCPDDDPDEDAKSASSAHKDDEPEFDVLLDEAALVIRDWIIGGEQANRLVDSSAIPSSDPISSSNPQAEAIVD